MGWIVNEFIISLGNHWEIIGERTKFAFWLFFCDFYKQLYILSLGIDKGENKVRTSTNNIIFLSLGIDKGENNVRNSTNNYIFSLWEINKERR